LNEADGNPCGRGREKPQRSQNHQSAMQVRLPTEDNCKSYEYYEWNEQANQLESQKRERTSRSVRHTIFSASHDDGSFDRDQDQEWR